MLPWEQKQAAVSAVAVPLEHFLAELGLAEFARDRSGTSLSCPYSNRDDRQRSTVAEGYPEPGRVSLASFVRNGLSGVGL